MARLQQLFDQIDLLVKRLVHAICKCQSNCCRPQAIPVRRSRMWDRFR